MNVVVKRLWKQWGGFFRRYYCNLKRMNLRVDDLMNCEHCQHVGVEPWHCHNNESKHWASNVFPQDVCEQFYPNEGVICYEWRRWDGFERKWRSAGVKPNKKR